MLFCQKQDREASRDSGLEVPLGGSPQGWAMPEATLCEGLDNAMGAEGRMSVTFLVGSPCTWGLSGPLHCWRGPCSSVDVACSRVQQCGWMSM